MYQIDFNHPSSIYFVGIGGISMSGLAEILADAGFRVSGSDRSKSPLTETLERKGINVFYGQRAANITDDIDCVVFTSAIHKDNPEYIATMEKGIPHLTRAQLLGEIMQNYKTPIAISGTHGKTTTTSLIYHIFKKAGYNVGLAGNIGQSLALQVAEKDYDYYVIELSSFQLDNMYRFRASIAVLLNITPDHLDRYDHCMQNYVDAKMRILQNQEETDAFVYWNDDPIIRKELEKYQIKAKKCPFSILKKEGMIGYLADGQYVIEYPTPFNMEQESLALTGKHNMYNSLAAGITADIAGVKNEVIRQSLSDFEGVEHRLEKVVRVRGVDYINDSKATNVDACWYALESMKTPTVLILGGKDKGNDYEAIAELVRKKCVGLVFLGADNGKLHAFFDSFGIPIADTHSMKDCVEACYRMARPGDTVLLSPCCASFDLFKNMEDRGEQFKSLVRAL